MRKHRSIEQTEPELRPSTESLGSGFFARQAPPAPRVPRDLLEVVLDELDSMAHAAARGDVTRPEASVTLASGIVVRGVVLEYVAWERVLVLRALVGDVFRIPTSSIASVVAHLSPENEAAIGLRGGSPRR